MKFKEYKADVLRLDLGAGKGLSTPSGFIPVDKNKWPGIKVVDLTKPWPWKTNSVDEVQANYLIQYFSGEQRVHFVNELYRVLKSGAKAIIHTPYWCSGKAYLDPGVQGPPVSEQWYLTLSKGWRDSCNYVDESGLTCDFDYTFGYGMHAEIVPRNLEYQQHAIKFFKEAAQDLIVTLIKK